MSSMGSSWFSPAMRSSNIMQVVIHLSLVQLVASESYLINSQPHIHVDSQLQDEDLVKDASSLAVVGDLKPKLLLSQLDQAAPVTQQLNPNEKQLELLKQIQQVNHQLNDDVIYDQVNFQSQGASSYVKQDLKELAVNLQNEEEQHSYSDKQKLSRRFREAQRQREEEDESDDGMYSSRSFAIGLVGIASCYLVVMICKAYRKINEDAGSYDEETITYYYDTESYDFLQYQSGDEKGFEYNISINGSVSHDDNQSDTQLIAYRNQKNVVAASMGDYNGQDLDFGGQVVNQSGDVQTQDFKHPRPQFQINKAILNSIDSKPNIAHPRQTGFKGSESEQSSIQGRDNFVLPQINKCGSDLLNPIQINRQIASLEKVKEMEQRRKSRVSNDAKSNGSSFLGRFFNKPYSNKQNNEQLRQNIRSNGRQLKQKKRVRSKQITSPDERSKIMTLNNKQQSLPLTQQNLEMISKNQFESIHEQQLAQFVGPRNAVPLSQDGCAERLNINKIEFLNNRTNSLDTPPMYDNARNLAIDKEESATSDVINFEANYSNVMIDKSKQIKESLLQDEVNNGQKQQDGVGGGFNDSKDDIDDIAHGASKEQMYLQKQ